MSLGVLQGAGGRPEVGLEALVRALPHAKDPKLRSEILRNAAYAYQVTGRRVEALREYEKALAENPQNEAARAALEALRKGGALRGSSARQEERRCRLEAALARLEPLDREIIVLRNIEGLSGAEAAQVLGIPEPAAPTKYLGAVEALREVLRAGAP
ncbi:MAG: hypothetical protein HY721_18255 [Planctomycetes bacterium]|nr:hypothetical protein [Planctomycetota bacterium]